MSVISFEFTKPWNHAGKSYMPGDKAALSKAEVEKLVRLGAGTAALDNTEKVTRSPSKT